MVIAMRMRRGQSFSEAFAAVKAARPCVAALEKPENESLLRALQNMETAVDEL